MVFSKVFTPLFAIVLAAAVNATPAVSPETNPSEIAKRTPGNVYLCDSTGWGLPCITESAADTCVDLPIAWQHRIQSFGPDPGATCYGYPAVGCGGEEWGPFTYPGDSTAGWSTLRPWGLAIDSICCDVNEHTCPHGGSGGGGQCPGPTPYTGRATYYYPNGGTGACGWTINNGDMAVALGTDHWDSGAHCGKQITVAFGGATICVTVADLCPGCQVPNGIDLTQGAMAALDPNWFAHGVDTVQWGFA